MAFKTFLFSLATLPLVNSETVLGVYIFHRHGDRTPKALAPTNLTALGADEVFQSGTYYRSKYISSNASTPIHGLSNDIAVPSQLNVISPSDSVLQSSALAFLQGIYPPAGSNSVSILANKSEVVAPLDGYQYIPISTSSVTASSANSENSEWLQGGSGCGNAVVSSNNYLSSSEYLSLLSSTKSFYTDLLPVYNATFSASQATFKNAYTIFDLVNVATIHNQTISDSQLLTNETLFQLRTLADNHEWNLAYNSSDPIRAIAGATLAAQIVQQLNATLNKKGSTPVSIQFGAYASFMSFFGLAQLEKVSADFTGVVDYASSIAFELVTNATNVSTANYPSTNDVSVRFYMANGTAAVNAPKIYPLFGQTETTISWSTFTNEMNKFAIGDTTSWCAACGNTTGICATSASTSGADGGSTAAQTKSGNGVTLPVAGVIGALVTLVVILGVEGLVYALAGLKLVKKSTLAAAAAAGTGVTAAGAAAGAKA
ncbi:phosphoglycerate mutase-like protein [Annulohypoxylon maeteangense]|uniref:phosphoglycerate mutase-like protein n=1 Tax=Annulohypoxylon maeteangense TaxID=1927788 RepID=UPI0020081034|nr:phosphoglycerate mutase-like protein [Annulohypoxylon maeteangense]KAI0882744.1 phosphoglycerate mutase-like protein [Annulohypoxylon maeteangense]